MSALLAAASAVFSYQGASVTLACSSPDELKNALATFGIGAANDTPAPGKSNPASTAATAPAGASAGPAAAAASSAQVAAAQAAGDAGNAGTTSGSAAAQTASSSAASESPAVTFDELKKAFLALSAKAGGREKCQAVLKPFNLEKLSAATPEQYAAVMAEIQKASA